MRPVSRQLWALLLLYLQNCSMYFSAQLLLFDMIFLTLSRKPGKTSFKFCPVFTYSMICHCQQLRFKLNQITRKKSGRTWLTMLLTWEILTRPTRKLWLNQTYQAFEVKSINQIYQKTLVKLGFPGFWGGKFPPGLPGKPGNALLTRHFWLGFLSRDLSYQTFLVNYNQF